MDGYTQCTTCNLSIRDDLLNNQHRCQNCLRIDGVKAELEETIADWQKRMASAAGHNEALELAHKFDEACREGIPIPAWALALRTLAGWIVREKAYKEKEARLAANRDNHSPARGFHG